MGDVLEVHGKAVSRGGSAVIRAIAVASGKGGVGKTNIVANLAVALRRRGQRVILVDADLGLANLDVLLGLNPVHTLRDVLAGNCTVGDVLVEGPEGVHVLPAASGFEELTMLGPEERLLLLNEIDRLEGRYDFMLIDVAAGISPNVLYFTMAARELVIVVTPEPTSLTDAYALIKILSRKYGQEEFRVVVNMAPSELEAKRTFTHLTRVADRFLNVSLAFLGWIPFDEEVTRAVRKQRAVVDLSPMAQASRSLGDVADRILATPQTGLMSGGIQFFFEQLLVERGA